MTNGDDFFYQHLEYIGKDLYGAPRSYTHRSQATLECCTDFSLHEYHNDSNHCVGKHDAYADSHTLYKYRQPFGHEGGKH